MNTQVNDNISNNNSKSENRIEPTNGAMNKDKYNKSNNISNEDDEENEIYESDSETDT